MSNSAIRARLPRRVEEIDTAWLNSVLGGGVDDAKIAQVIHGTATKIAVDVTFAPPREPSRERLWVKTGMEPHSRREGMSHVYAGETLFYRDLADKYETRTPRCYFADTDDSGASVVILEDVLAQGARFTELTQPASPDFVARGLEHIARRQAASWMAQELWANDWLRMGGSHRASDLPGWVWSVENWDRLSRQPRFRLLPGGWTREAMQQSSRNLQDILFLSEPWALAQGDAHYGQAYELPDGEVRLLDWSAVQVGHWCHDVSYFMVSALSPEDRRASEEDLLRDYLGKLKAFGVENPPTIEQALKDYSTGLLHGVGWVMCPTEMQPEENCCAMTERFVAAAQDRNSVELALALRA